MLRARDGFRVVALGDETILAVGDDGACHPGSAEPGSETSERYDPIADEWTVAAALNKPRKDFAMVPTANGGVMVVGGLNGEDQPYSSTKVFDLDAAVWRDGPLLARAYGDPSAVTVEDGRTYVVGPTTLEETTSTSTAEILAEGSDTWGDGGRIDGAWVHSITAMSDGTLVAIATGADLPDMLFIHDSGGAEGWQPLTAPDVTVIERVVPFAGGMLAFGLRYDEATGAVMPISPLRWDPIAGDWIETGAMAFPRAGAATVTLADGRILVAAGVGGFQDISEGELTTTTEVYDPAAQTWSAGPDLLGPRDGGQAVVLDDGSVLIMGGVAVRNEFGDTPFCPGTLTSVERIFPTPWVAPEV